jgi:hypothetical protein
LSVEAVAEKIRQDRRTDCREAASVLYHVGDPLDARTAAIVPTSYAAQP